MIYSDNEFVLSMTHILIQFDQIKHVGIDQHYIKKKLDNNFFCTLYNPTHNQLLNTLTKEWMGHYFKYLYPKWD